MQHLLVAALVALGVSGCTASSAGSDFTSMEQLKQLTSRPKPTHVFTEKVADVPQWELAGPFPESVGLAPHEQQSEAGKMVVEEAGKRHAQPTAAFACAARELARFIAEKKEQPPSLLRAFIAGRCGTGVASLASTWVQGEAPDSVTDAALVSKWRANLEKAFASLGPDAQVGAALVRQGSRAVIALAWAEVHGALEPVSIFPSADGVVELHGAVSGRVDQLAGTVGLGEVGAAACTNLGLRPLPAFDLRCVADPKDTSAAISIETFKQGRFLGQETFRVLVWPSRQPSNTWALHPVVRAGVPATVPGLAEEINALRAKASLAPLEVSAAQSDDLREAAPFFFQATAGGDERLCDELALGIIAGWRVEKDIASGTFTSEISERPDGSLFLTHALLSPATRATLFDPRASVLAIGLFEEREVVGGVLSVYRRLEAPAVEGLVKDLDAARARLGRGPVKWVRLPGSGEASVAEAVHRRELDLEDGLQRLMEASIAGTTRGAQGFTLIHSDLQNLQWPAEVLNRPEVEVVMAATTVRQPKAPWGTVVIFVATPTAEGQ